jgi:hypothetical protein
MLDPYSRFQYTIPFGSIEIDILVEKKIKDMAASFQKHPAIAMILGNPLPQIDDSNETKYIHAITKLIDSLLRAGILDAPAEFNEIFFEQNKDDPRRVITRQLIAIICVRQSLSILNQLIYQAILNDELSILNEDNIIDIIGPVSHTAGGGFSIILQPNWQTITTSLLDLVQIKCMASRMPIDQLCRVEGINHSYSGEFGSTEEFKLRTVDENLNPFGTLLINI